MEYANNGWVVMQGSADQIFATFDGFASVTLFGEAASGPIPIDTGDANQMTQNGKWKWISNQYELSCVKNTDTNYYQIVVSKL